MNDSDKQRLSDRLTKSYTESVKINNFNPHLVQLLENIKNERSIPNEWALTSVLTSVASLGYNTHVCVNKTFNEPIFLYTVIAGLPSTKKSRCARMLKEFFVELRQECSDAVTLNNSITVESMIELMGNCENHNLLQIWDEFNTFIEQFGLYKSGGGAFDRSIYNTIYNGEEELQYQTKKSQFAILQPRLSIFGCAHPHRVIDLLEREKEMATSCDGLMSRFLIAAPKPERQELKKDIPQSDGINLNQLLRGVCTLNKKLIVETNKVVTRQSLKLDDSAFDMINSKFKEYEEIAQRFEIENPFICFVYGKATGQLLRLCGICKLMNSVFKMLDTDNVLVNKSIKDFCAFIDNQTVDFIISTSDVECAIDINEYYINQKLILSGISIDIKDPSSISGKSIEANLFPLNEIKLERKILLSDGDTVFFESNKHFKVTDFEAASAKLKRFNLGFLTQEKKDASSTSQKKSKCFKKRDLDELEENDKLIVLNALIKFQVDPELYKETFSKRKFSEDDDIENEPELKRTKRN